METTGHLSSLPPRSGHLLPLCRHTDPTAVQMLCFRFTDPRHCRCLGIQKGPLRAAPQSSSCLIPSASLALMSLSLWPSALVSHGGPDRIARFSKKNMRCPVRFELQIHNKSFLSTSHAITEHLLYLSDIQGGCGSNPRE